MKNLEFALRVLAEVKTEVLFTIYGIKQDSRHWNKCQSLIDRLPFNIRVIDKGELSHAEVRQTLSLHDLFFLPTRGENFGHVIHEALSSGLPVLLSDQTPWNEVSALGIGWVYPLDETAPFALAIENYAALPSEFITEMREKAMSFAKERTFDAKALEDNRRLFETALSPSICY
jgi:glycosyltransferase involved in cell wall biosynthesis